MHITICSERIIAGWNPAKGTSNNNKKKMTSYYKEGSKIQFEGYRGEVIKITETYRKNVLVVKITSFPNTKNAIRTTSSLGLFEYPDGKLEFMTFID